VLKLTTPAGSSLDVQSSDDEEAIKFMFIHSFLAHNDSFIIHLYNVTNNYVQFK